MRAQVQRGFGGEEVVAVEAVPDPVPGPGEVALAVRACGLNRLDLLQRRAPVVRGFSLPHIAGMDVAGVVVERAADLRDDVGPEVGARVLVDPVSTCGTCDRCSAGLAPYCAMLRTVGMLLDSLGHPELGQSIELAAAEAIHRQVRILNASTEQDIHTAFTTLAQSRIGALLVTANPFFNSRRGHLAIAGGICSLFCKLGAVMVRRHRHCNFRNWFCVPGTGRPRQPLDICPGLARQLFLHAFRF